MKTLASVLCTLTVSLAAAQVTYLTTGATTTKVVADIAKSTGQKLTVDKELAKEIVVVSVKDISLDEFKKHLADCVSGKWVAKDGGELQLEVDSSLSSIREKQALQSFANRAVLSIDSNIAELLPLAKQGGGVGGHYASRILAYEIAKKIPLSAYADLKMGERIVLSSHPNRMQRQMPNVFAILEAAKNERNKRSIEEEAAQGRTITILEDPYVSYIVSIERTSSRGFVSGYRLLTAAGHTGSGTSFIDEPEEPIEVQSTEGSTISWSPMALQLSRNYNNWSAAATYGLQPLADDLIEVLSDPVKHEPMSFAFGEGVLAYAKDKRANLIASIPDSEAIGHLGFARQGMLSGEFWRLLKRRKQIVTEESNGWVTVMPADPVSARKLRGDRAALKKLIDAGGERLYPTLEQLGEFAASTPAAAAISTPFVVPFFALIGSDAGGEAVIEYQPQTWRALQLFSQLSSGQRLRLRNGEKLALGSLAQNAKETLAMLFFGAPQPLEGWEPTLIMPNGLPNSGTLSAAVETSPVMAPLPDGGELETPPRPMGPLQLARLRLERESSESPYAQDLPTFSRMRLGTRTTWRFTLDVGGGNLRSLVLSEDDVAPKSRIYTTRELPSHIKAAFDRAYESERKRLFGGE